MTLGRIDLLGEVCELFGPFLLQLQEHGQCTATPVYGQFAQGVMSFVAQGYAILNVELALGPSPCRKDVMCGQPFG